MSNSNHPEIVTNVFAVVRNTRFRTTTVFKTQRIFTEWFEATTGYFDPRDALAAHKAGKIDISHWEIVGGYLFDLLYIESLIELGK